MQHVPSEGQCDGHFQIACRTHWRKRGIVALIIMAYQVRDKYAIRRAEKPPVITGAVVMVIGLNLAPLAINDASSSGYDTVMAIVTVLAVAAVAVYAPGPLRRLPILLGGIVGYVVYVIFS